MDSAMAGGGSAPMQEYDEYDDVDNPEKAAAEKLQAQLDAFGWSLARKRSDAIGYRETSGIEEIWREDQDFYEGVDDLNRNDERSLRTDKPPYSGSNQNTVRAGRGQSRVFPNITGPFVEAGAAHLADILLPSETPPPWKLEATPIPDLMEKARRYEEEDPDGAEAERSRPFSDRVADGGQAPQRNQSEEADDRMQDQPDAIDGKQAFQQTELAKAIAEAAQTRIWDWHVESQFLWHVREVIEDAARIGVGVLKGPVPAVERKIGWKAEETSVDDFGREISEPGEIRLDQDIKPVSKRISPWNFYPGKGCGEDIQNGDCTWEKDMLTRRQVRDLKLDESYIVSQIDGVLEEGPTRAISELPETRSVDSSEDYQDKFEIWYGYCQAEREDLEAAEVDLEGLEDVDVAIDVAVVMINYRVVRVSRPATDYTGFPYETWSWRKRQNFWAGIGISRQCRTAQKIVVGATRSMMNNAGLAGGPMIVFKQGVVQPADGVAGLGPRKVFYIQKDDQTIDDARKAIGVVKVDIMVNEMMAIINFGLQMAENNTGFPLLMQGQQGSAPDKVGVVNVLDKNTNAIKRRMARSFSDHLMARHLKRYYVYHLMHGPDDEKGDLQVNVKGYAALVERDIQNQEIGQLYNIVLDPRFELDPAKWAKEFLRSRHLDPGAMEIDDEQRAELLQNFAAFMEAGQQDPRVKVAQINAQAGLQKVQMQIEGQGAIQISKNQHDAMMKQMQSRLQLVIAESNGRIEELKRQGVSEDTIRKLKAQIAQEVMKIKSTFQLVNMKAGADELPQPPVEPPGLAPPGESYTQ